MATIKVTDLPVIEGIPEDAKLFLTKYVQDDEGVMKEALMRASLESVIKALKKYGIDGVTFDEVSYDPNEGYIHFRFKGEDAVEPCWVGKKAHTVEVDGKPIYGCRFVKLDSNGDWSLSEDGTGDYLLTCLEDGTVKAVKVITTVTDNLESENADEALSAKQGKILSGFIGKTSELLTNSKTSLVDAVNELRGKLKGHLENQRVHTSVFFPGDTPEGNNYIWYSPYENGVTEEYNGIVFEAVQYNGDDKKLHGEVKNENYTFENTTIESENGSTVVEVS